jgi:hypothetical protein
VKRSYTKIKNKKLLLPVLGLAMLGSAVLIGATPSSYASDSATSEVTVNVGTVISITAEDITIDMSAPSPTGTFATGTGQVSVKTNDVNGYSVYLTSNSTTSTTLDHESVATSKINSIATSETVGGATTKFATNNTWGWSKDGSVFYPVLAKGEKDGINDGVTLYRTTDAPSPSGDTSTLTIGATVDSTLTSGAYTGTLLLTAVSNSNGTEICTYSYCHM